MKFYVAPLEGITGYIFRKVHHKFFPGADKYYIPFIEPKPGAKKIFGSREYNDLLPEHNNGIYAVPQILTNKAEDFIWTANHIIDMGYNELNINLGCPSKTVASKNRGSGFLAFPEEVDCFLEKIYNSILVPISVKTRVGRYDAAEFETIMGIYEKYPMNELIIHPRTQLDFYKGAIHYDTYTYAYEKCHHPLCYNGDLFTVEDFEHLLIQFPKTECVMLGRGLLMNPALIRMMQGGPDLNKDEFLNYFYEMEAEYRNVLSGEVHVICKLKELWGFMAYLFDDVQDLSKKVKKAKSLSQLNAAIDDIFRHCELNFDNKIITVK